MEWLWTPVAMVVAGLVTFLITKKGLSGTISKHISKIEDTLNAANELAGVILSALAPDSDGTVRLSEEEVNKIKASLEKLLAALKGPTS